jgi:hypothetical protein
VTYSNARLKTILRGVAKVVPHQAPLLLQLLSTNAGIGAAEPLAMTCN